MMVKYSFVVTDGPDLGRTFELEPGVTLIGRLKEATANDPEGSRRWVLLDKTVSRTHSELSWDHPGAPLLTHLSQTNDTYIDRRRITEEVLQPGQSVQMGQTIMTVQLEKDYGWGAEAAKEEREAKQSKAKAKPPNLSRLTPAWASAGGSGGESDSESGSWGEWESGEANAASGTGGDSDSWGGMFNSTDRPTEKLGYHPVSLHDSDKSDPASESGEGVDSWAFLPTDTLGVDPFACGQSAEGVEEPAPYTLRFAELSDGPAISEMVRACQQERGLKFDPAKSIGALKQLIKNAHLGLLWLIVAEREMIGYVCLTFGFSLEHGGRDAHLNDLYVKPEHRRKGLGTGAVVAALAEAEEQGVKAVHLEVNAVNKSVRRIYKAQGFEIRDEFFLMTRVLD